MWLMRYCQMKQYSHVGVSAEERKERTENLFKEITVENVPKSGERYGHSGTQNSKIPKEILPKEIFIKIHFNQTLKNQRLREF